MQTFALRIIAALVVIQVSSVCAAADPCALISASDASALIGQSVKAFPAGPEKDEDSPGQLSYCTYRSPAAPTSALIVSVVEFRSDAEAKKYFTKNLVQSRMDDEAARVTEESGIGERSFYGATSNGAMYAFLVKNKVVGVGLGGSPAATKKVPKDALRRAAQSIASRV